MRKRFLHFNTGRGAAEINAVATIAPVDKSVYSTRRHDYI